MGRASPHDTQCRYAQGDPLIREELDRDVQMGAAVGDADEGLLRRRPAGMRVDEVRPHLGVLPEGFVRNAVDHDRHIGLQGLQRGNGGVGVVVGQTWGPPCQQCNSRNDAQADQGPCNVCSHAGLSLWF